MALDCWLGLTVQIGLAIRYIRPTWRRPFERTETDPVVQRVYTSIGDVIRRLTVREAARTHSIDETTTDEMFRFLSENPFLDAEKEAFRFVGNSIPVMTLDAALSHILSILRW